MTAETTAHAEPAPVHSEPSRLNDTATDPQGEGGKSPSRLKLAGLAVLAVGLVIASRLLPIDEWMTTVKEQVATLGPWGPVAYGLFYVVAALLFVPGSLITITAGALFGLGVGTAVVSLASTTSAALAMPLARTTLRGRVEALAAQRPSFRAIDGAIEDGGWKIVGLLRLSPVVPFNVLNYLLGLTNVRYVPAVLVSWIAMLPGTMLYVYFGAIGRDVAAGEARGPFEWALMIAGLVATLAVTVVLTRMARSRMKESTDLPA